MAPANGSSPATEKFAGSVGSKVEGAKLRIDGAALSR